MSTISNAIPLAVRNASVSVARRLRFRYLVIALLFALLTASVYVRYSYKGFTTGFYRQMRYSSTGENRNLWFLIGYWLEYMQLLKFNESTGFYSFDNVDESGMDQFARGRLEYHRGNFAGAVSLIEKDIEKNGEGIRTVLK